MAEKTIDDFIGNDLKEMPFKDRAAKYEAEIKPIVEKYGVMPWAGLQSTNEIIAAVPQLKDLWEETADV